MDIATLIVNIAELAERCGMTFNEMLEWISRNDRDEDILPWEE